MVEFPYMKNAFVHISRVVMNWLYRLYCSSGTRKDEVVFLSRQADVPSYDYAQLAHEFEEAGWTVHMHLKKVKAANMLSYIGHVVRELKLLAHCRVVVLDRYDPVVSLIDFECETISDDIRAQAATIRAEGGELHTEYPIQPTIVQLWHAFGAYKKFGYQSIGTREGHLRRTIDTFNIHRNYSWIMCSGHGCREAYAEAFAYPIDRVIAYNRPEYFELVGLAADSTAARTTTLNVVLAPTLRKSKASAHPFRDLYEQRDEFQNLLNQRTSNPVNLEWSFHPLEEHLPAPGNASESLLKADVIVTDYSSIVYEAYLLKRPVLFYVPDIDDYRESPGLNTDPGHTVPTLCAYSSNELIDMLVDCLDNLDEYAQRLAPFTTDAFDATPSTPKPETLRDALKRAQ